CCANAENGQVAATPPTNLMNARRLIASPEAEDRGIVSGRTSNVRFGSKADMCSATEYVR
ncbi:MAG: hypothetical protein WBC87_14420, partial [Pseudolabrys sp.]